MNYENADQSTSTTNAAGLIQYDSTYAGYLPVKQEYDSSVIAPGFEDQYQNPDYEEKSEEKEQEELKEEQKVPIVSPEKPSRLSGIMKNVVYLVAILITIATIGFCGCSAYRSKYKKSKKDIFE